MKRHFPKMLKDVGMAVPKPPKVDMYVDGSVQATQGIGGLHK